VRAIISHVSDVCVELRNEKVAVLIRLYVLGTYVMRFRSNVR
jgi:hypothetical protein